MNRDIAVQALTPENFRKYGSFSNLLEPDGPKLGDNKIEFFRDMEVLTLGHANSVAFSVTKVQKRNLVIDSLEYHTNTGEGLLPLDGDILVHVAPAAPKGCIELDQIEAFRVPKGTLVNLRPGVMHCAPYSVAEDFVHVVIALPERTYANDFVFNSIPDEEQIRIIFT